MWPKQPADAVAADLPITFLQLPWTLGRGFFSCDQLTRAHYFGKEFLEKLLDEPGCAGLRIYQAIDDAGIGRVVLVGVDEKGNDLLPRKDDGTLLVDTDEAADALLRCPDQCGQNSPLMQ